MEVPVFKRKHYGTPQSTMLIIVNYVVFAVILAITDASAGWFFWIAMALLARYNYFNIRKDREEYSKIRIIAYVISVVVMVALFFVFRFANHKH